MTKPCMVSVFLLLGLNVALAHEAPVATNLVANGDFGDKLAGWDVATQSAQVKVLNTYNAWNTYSLQFKSGDRSQVYFYISVFPDPNPGGEVWLDNIRMNDAPIKNPGFEQTHVNGLPDDWEYEHRMYNKTKRHAKLHLGTDYQYASEGSLSLRMFAPPQTNTWKLRLKEPPAGVTSGWQPPEAGMPPWRPLYEGEFRVWQAIEVKPNTDYTLSMDYRVSKSFVGTIRPAIGASLENWGLIAHAGWQWTVFKEQLRLRDMFGRSLATMQITGGRAAMSQQVNVPARQTLHASVDVSTSRSNNGKPLEMTAKLIVEDAATGKVLGEDRFVWDGTPGHGEGLSGKGEQVEGNSALLRVSFVSPSDKVRVRIVGEGAGDVGTILVGKVRLANAPRLTPPVQQITLKDAASNFRINDRITYTAGADVAGALWLVAHDLKQHGIDLVESDSAADVRIVIGQFSEHGDQGYRLIVDSQGIRVDAATPRAAQYALMTMLQLLGRDLEGPFLTGADITDWPDMPVRGVVMESCSHFTPRSASPVRLTDQLYHGNERQTWARSDLLQLVRWKLNMVWWRSTGMSRQLLDEADRFHIDSMGFISTISDPPTHGIFVEHPDWIEGVLVEDEPVTLKAFEPAKLAKPHVIRDELTDVIVQSTDKKTTYEPGKDYRVAGKMGTYDAGKKKMEGGKPFTLARIEGSRIPDGGEVLVRYDYIDKGEHYSWHTQYCLGKPQAVEWVGEQAKQAAGRWRHKYINIRGDELTHVNSDSRSKRLGLKSTDLLINRLKFIRDKVHEGSPDTQVCMWHDAFSPYFGGSAWGVHPARPGAAGGYLATGVVLRPRHADRPGLGEPQDLAAPRS